MGHDRPAENFDGVGASLDTVRRGAETAVKRLVADLPLPGTMMEFTIGEVRTWHNAPGVWVDLTVSL